MLVTGAIGAVAGGIGGAIYSQVKYGEVRWQNVAAGAAIGGAVGLTGGAAGGYLLAGKATASTGAVILGGKMQIAALGTSGYGSYYLFKKAHGSAGSGRAWHHVVGQTANNIARFGNQQIHNLRNLVNVPHGRATFHQAITNHYNSLHSSGMCVYEWLSTQSYRAQLNYVLELMVKYNKEFGNVIECIKK